MHRLVATSLAVLVLLALAASSIAAEEKASNRTYLKMMDVQELWNEERYNDALQMLRAFEPGTVGKPYDQAVVLQYIAHTAVFMDDVEGARAALGKALQLSNIGTQLTADLKLVYGQIVIGDGEFEEARQAIEYWYEHTENEKQPNLLFTLGYANYMTEHMARAEELLAIAIANEPSPRESWYRIYYQTLFEQRKYAQAEELLLGMIERAPYENDNWRLLANHHVQLEDRRKALAAVTIAYNEGLLEGADDLKRLITLYSAIEVPEKSARLLEHHLGTEELDTDAEALKRLAGLWLLARERSRAKDVLEEAATAAPDGHTFEMLGNIYFEDEEWENAHDSYLKALEIGGFDEPERIYLLAGISAEQGGMKDAARTALEEARKSDALRKQADALLRRLDRS
jgi:tetratricopeptide (TPR) repeat protein